MMKFFVFYLIQIHRAYLCAEIIEQSDGWNGPNRFYYWAKYFGEYISSDHTAIFVHSWSLVVWRRDNWLGQRICCRKKVCTIFEHFIKVLPASNLLLLVLTADFWRYRSNDLIASEEDMKIVQRSSQYATYLLLMH